MSANGEAIPRPQPVNEATNAGRILEGAQRQILAEKQAVPCARWVCSPPELAERSSVSSSPTWP